MDKKKYSLEEIAKAYAKWNVCAGCTAGKCEPNFCLFNEEYEYMLRILKEAIEDS